MIAPCFVFHGWWNGPSPGFLLVLALRLCTRVKPLAGGPGASLSHCRALRKNGDPNSGLFSRPRLAVDEREHGLPLGIHLYLASLTFIFDCFAWWAGHDPHSATPQPSRLCRWWTAQWSFSSSSSFNLSSPSSSLESDGQSRPPQHVLVAGFSTRPSSPWRSFPSPFPLVFLPFIRDGRHCGWHGAPRFLSLVRFWGVGWTLLLDL